MSEFSDRPFVAGGLVGLRAFSVDRLGRLVGPQFPSAVFTPFENEARCLKSEQGFSVGGLVMPMPSWTIRYTSTGDAEIAPDSSPAKKEAQEEPKPRPEHTLAGLSCGCGFYAYFDGSNEYRAQDRVNAVIEGYGVCTVGTRGFRASKARLVALITPKSRYFPARTWERVLANYSDVPVYERKRDALAAHPLTAPEVPTPATDPEFWTRRA